MKRPKRNLAGEFKYPVIVLLPEKHGTGKFIVSSDEEMGKLAIETVNRRWEQSWYGTVESAMAALERYHSELDVAQTAWEAAERTTGIPEYTVKEYERKVASAKRWIREAEQDVANATLIQEFINTQDPELAVEVLFSRRDYQYEGIEVETSGSWG